MTLGFGTDIRLMVSLPRNDVRLARAAADAGADALKAHLHVSHRVSGASFGSFQREQARLRPILDLDVPVGLVVDGNHQDLVTELARATDAGVAFFDSFFSHASPSYLRYADAPLVVALDADSDERDLHALEASDVAAIEAAIVRPEEYGTPPPSTWVSRLREMRMATRLPLIIPTQHAITTDHLAELVQLDPCVLLLGAIVTGTDPHSVATATAEYRRSLDRSIADLGLN